MKILLAEDDRDSRELLTDYLEDQLGHEVTACENGSEAWEHFQRDDYLLVISDIRMPRMDGIQLMEKIKQSGRGSDSDVILMSAFEKTYRKQNLIGNGACGFLSKPVDLFRLDSLVEESCRRHGG